MTALGRFLRKSSIDEFPQLFNALAVQYVLNWSPWLDIWILLRTAGAVLFMRGAC